MPHALLESYEMSPLTVSVLGGLVQNIATVVDQIPDTGETVDATQIALHPGKGSNSAVAIHRLTRSNPNKDQTSRTDSDDRDIRVRMVGAVGLDAFGTTLVQNLEKHGVNTEGLTRKEVEPTSVANILIETRSGAKRTVRSRGAAGSLMPNDFMTAESLGGGVIPDFMVAQLEIDRKAIEQAIQTAHQAQIEVLLNPSPPLNILTELYAKIKHLILNEHEADMLSPIDYRKEELMKESGLAKFAKYFHGLGVENVAITLGTRGAYYSTENGETGSVEAEKIHQVAEMSEPGYEGRFLPTEVPS